MLLPLRSISRILRPLQLLQPSHTRSLTTLPKPIAPFIKPWDPSKHTPRPAVLVDPQDGSRHEQLRIERAQRHQAQGFMVFPRGAAMYTHVARAEITKLNHLLRLADTKSDHPGLRLQLWDTYRRLRNRFSEAIYAIPDRAWDILWKIQETRINPLDNSSHLTELEKDMASCGDYEPSGRRIRYLHGLFLSGHEKQALKEWDEDYEGSNGLPRHDHKPEHLELGAKLYALSGHPDRAHEIMQELFELYPSWDHDVTKTVFRALTSSISIQHHEFAYGIYKKSKQVLGEDMMLGDYDVCFIGFLEARHLTYAKLVFRDMINEGHLARSYSTGEIQDVLNRLHMLYRLGTNISKMTSIGLQAVKTLPPAYHSHVFAHWMRSAVVGNASAAAGQILDLMFRRNSQPKTVHLNLLLKALMRTELDQPEDNPHVSRAENIGWRMIEEARKASAEKLPFVSASELIRRGNEEETELMANDEDLYENLRHVPPANVTTFAIMIKHHGTKQQWEHVDYLTRQLKERGFRPNAALMNALMDIKCRQGKFSEVWTIYKSLTDVPAGAHGVFPDGSSIRCLWKTLRLALGDQTVRKDPNLPQPRELLAETVHWWMRCRGRSDMERFRIGLAATDHGAISSLVMHCFSYMNDLAGSLVGLHVLRKEFGIFPTDESAEILQRHAAWVDMTARNPSERSSFYHRGIYKKNIAKVGQVYHILEERRRHSMNITEDDYAKFTNEEVRDLGLNLLSEFIRVVLKRSYGPARTEAIITRAKEAAGVPDMSTGDLDAFQVV
jgi:pentatricopeptide repeat protein